MGGRKKVAGMGEVVNAELARERYAGRIEGAANIHLAASIPNLLIAETIETEFHDALIKGSIRVDNGFINAPQGAGLGIDVDEEFARAHPFDGVGLHLQMQDDPCDYQSQNSFLGGGRPKKS